MWLQGLGRHWVPNHSAYKSWKGSWTVFLIKMSWFQVWLGYFIKPSDCAPISFFWFQFSHLIAIRKAGINNALLLCCRGPKGFSSSQIGSAICINPFSEHLLSAGPGLDTGEYEVINGSYHWKILQKKAQEGIFDGSVVKIPCFHHKGAQDSIPGWRNKTPHAPWHQKE